MMKDAWKQKHDLYDKYTQEREIRSDLKVTAFATDRCVRLEVGKHWSPKIEGPNAKRPEPYNYAVTTRNVGTMRELAQALLEACDFVDESNPVWAERAHT